MLRTQCGHQKSLLTQLLLHALLLLLHGILLLLHLLFCCCQQAFGLVYICGRDGIASFLRNWQSSIECGRNEMQKTFICHKLLKHTHTHAYSDICHRYVTYAVNSLQGCCIHQRQHSNITAMVTYVAALANEVEIVQQKSNFQRESLRLRPATKANNK